MVILWILRRYKRPNGAAMSLGRTSTFLDIYIERDLRNGVITEEEAQELMDHFVMKLRLVKFLRLQNTMIYSLEILLGLLNQSLVWD